MSQVWLTEIKRDGGEGEGEASGGAGGVSGGREAWGGGYAWGGVANGSHALGYDTRMPWRMTHDI